jgi:hypothetical protein
MRWLALGFYESNTQPIRVLLSLLYKIYTKKEGSLSSFKPIPNYIYQMTFLKGFNCLLFTIF